MKDSYMLACPSPPPKDKVLMHKEGIFEERWGGRIEEAAKIDTYWEVKQ